MTVVYIGAGAYLPGVPQRDLTEAEWAALDAETRKLALDLKLYRVEQPATERKGGES